MTEAEWIAFLARPEFPAFNRSMLENPADDLPRLVFADWVEENHPHRRFVRQLRLSVTRPHDVLHCPAFPEVRGLHAGLWRGRLALEFRTVAGIEVGLRREEMDFLRVVLSSGWLWRLSIWVHGVDGQVTSPKFISSIRWSDVEWLDIGGHIDWQPALSQFVFARPELFPKLTVLVNRDDTPIAPVLHTMFASPLISRLTHFDLGYGRNWPEVVEAIHTSPHLTAEMLTRWGWESPDVSPSRC